MNKNILLIFALMFTLCLTVVTAEINCTNEDVVLTNVSNSSGNIRIDYSHCDINESSIIFGINFINNNNSGTGIGCYRLNDSICEDNNCSVLTTCKYPLTLPQGHNYQISGYCTGCKLPILYNFTSNYLSDSNGTNQTEEDNETVIEQPGNETEEDNETVETPVPVVQPKSRSSGGGGSSTVMVCDDWSECIGGVQNQSCNNDKITKERACEVEFVEPVVVVEEPEEVVKETTPEIVEKQSKTPFIVGGIILLLLCIASIIALHKLKN